MRMDIQIHNSQLEINCKKIFYKYFLKGREITCSVGLNKLVLRDLEQVGIVEFLEKKYFLNQDIFLKLSTPKTKVVLFFLVHNQLAEAVVSEYLGCVKSELLLITTEGIKRASAIKADGEMVRVFGELQARRFAQEALY